MKSLALPSITWPFHIFLLLLLCLPALQAQSAKRTVFPANAPKPVGPYSPGVVAGHYVYVAGQGVRRPDGKQADAFEEQARQCFENVKAIVRAAGLSMSDVVYMQAHVLRDDQLAVVETLYREYFPSSPPARSTVVVDLMPTATPVEINAIAYARPTQPVRVAGYGEAGWQTPAITAGDRIYFSGASGASPAQALAKLAAIVQAAGSSLDRVGYLHVYFTKDLTPEQIDAEIRRHWTASDRPAITYAPVIGLPRGARIQITGVAAQPGADLRHHKASDGSTSCAVIAGAAYCSMHTPSREGALGASIEDQTENVFKNIRSVLEPTGVTLDDVVAATVYLNDLNDFQPMNAVYGRQYQAGRPARTTLQPSPPKPQSPLVRIAVIAER